MPCLLRPLSTGRTPHGPRRAAFIRHPVSYLLVALAALVGGMLGGVLHSQTTQVLGGRFVLLDSGGIQRGVVEVTSAGDARIVMTGRNSQTPSASLGVDADGNAYLLLRDGGGLARAGLEVGGDGATRLVLLGGGSGGARVQLREGPDGGAALELRDAIGRTRAVLATGADGAPALTLYDADGNVTWSTP